MQEKLKNILTSSKELLSSMRFAVALLTVICIASAIGTVLVQHEPQVNYVNQFGPFWAQLFLKLQLNAVYSAWWFLLILAFLVISTTLCIIKNTPKFLADIKNYKENIREQSLKSFHHNAQNTLNENAGQLSQNISAALIKLGWKVKIQEREIKSSEGNTEKGYMVAAKSGAANKLGYIAAHSAIVLICIGGLFDGDLFVRAMTWIGGKSVYTGEGFVSEVPAKHRLPENNPAFRGNIVVAENTQSSTAILSQSDGILLQELPFAIELEKFIVEYYPTGMPRLFASDVVLHDKETGETKKTRIEVNHPAKYKGISIYQSSFTDGGSKVSLNSIPLKSNAKPFNLESKIGSSSIITNGDKKYTVEYTDLKVINVENMANEPEQNNGKIDVRAVDLGHSLSQRLGAGDKVTEKRDMRNIGPSIAYRIRDEAGQASEYQNYMLPIDTGDGSPVFLLGSRESLAQPMRYLRIPADEDASMQTFLQLYANLKTPAKLQIAAKQYAEKVAQGSSKEMIAQLEESASRILFLFAGINSQGENSEFSGLQALSKFIEETVPENERENATEVLMKIISGALFELNEISRKENGKSELEIDEKSQKFIMNTMLAISDIAFYPAPVALELKSFEQVQSSVFQVARAPGQAIVYLGCLFLILGIFAMLYIKDKRIWVWITPEKNINEPISENQNQTQKSNLIMAMSTNRKTLDTDKEFQQLKTNLLNITPQNTKHTS